MHTPVLLKEVVKYLDPAPGRKYLDCTLGYGGHTLALLQKGAKVTGIDQDVDILESAQKRIADAGYADQFTALHTSFSNALTNDRLPDNHYAGILFDLGVSSYQLDTPERGFSFRFDAPLDMRMDRGLAVTAKDLINGLGKNELVELFETLGEEHHTKKIVAKILETRKIKPITTTTELASLIEKIVTHRGKIHPATKIFQALRMAVNSEREELKAALPSALSKLTTNGTLATISFHSLEEKIILDFYAANQSSINLLSLDPITPSSQEILSNPRSRSAKLRVGRKS